MALAILSVLAVAQGAPAQQPGSPSHRPGQSWPRTQFPDGSGSIARPPGWRLNSARQAAAELQEPRGEAVAVGITMPIGPPRFNTPGSLAAPYMPPAEAYAWVSEVVARRSGGSHRRESWRWSRRRSPRTRAPRTCWRARSRRAVAIAPSRWSTPPCSATATASTT